ncbi:CHAT domain-containing tetratricopeptide repeat protein [Candidatus Thiosymbion oneisti]|uniref:CHAT domain-containing tetratricopeptide repeat protein n=1 Tax=Candidatus Thiosymbion oneisti TaxID=589554 RepID=UPI000AFE1E9C|nr:CHAT domain-containing protein [Candidatus Thiosymbion oneisti]
MGILRRWLGKGSGQPDRAQIPGYDEDTILATDLRTILREVNSPGQPSDMPRRVRLCRQALNLTDRGQAPDLWAALQGMLGSSLAQNPQGERAENLEQAIHHFKQALEVRTRTESPKQWAGIQNNLANAYADRIRGVRAENIDQAIHHYRQALQVITRSALPGQWAMTRHNLAHAYANRIHGERAENMEQAIHHFKQALEIRTRTDLPEQWAMTQHQLANAYADRIHGERAENLERAIQHFEQALKVRTRTALPKEWATTQHDLASAYLMRIRSEHAENLERAINHFGQALEVHTQADSPQDWALTQHDLASAYLLRIRGERAENLEQAIRHFGQALEVYTRADLPEQWALTQHDLAQAYAGRIHGQRGENLERAINHFGQALEVHTRAGLPAEHRRTQRDLGDLYFGQGDWAAAETAYTAALEAEADLRLQTHPETSHRGEAGSRIQAYIDVAYCALRLGRPAAGLLRLEQGKTHLLRETLALSEVELAALPAADRQAIESAREAVHDLEAEMHLAPDTPARRSDRELAEALPQARAELDYLIETIHAARPEFIPTGLDLGGLLDLIPAGGALVVPLFTSQGSAVFVVPRGTATVTQGHLVELEGFTAADLHTLLQGPPDEPQPAGWLGAYNKYRISPDSPSVKQAWLDRIETVGRELWDGVLGPVHERLQRQGLQQGAPVLFMPQGGLGLLPVHAAWRILDGHRRYFLDDWAIHYLPSGYALSVGRRRLQEARRQGQRLLAVVNPTQDLQFAPAEGKAVTARFSDFQRLEGDAATVEAIMQATPGCHYLHLACHGSYDWWDPMQSGLTLAAGQRFTLSKLIAELDLSASRLVTLSGCETGVTNIRRSPDEYLGLPAGLLQAGAPAVIGTLWPVADLSTGLLLERFYQNLLGHDGNQPLPAASALRAAQCWLRDVSAAALREKGGAAAVALAPAQASDTPFSHPYYWATFTFSGA